MRRSNSTMLLCMLLAISLVAQDRREGSLHPGDVAPDFTLARREGGAPITLSSFRGKQPVALVFGSFT